MPINKQTTDIDDLEQFDDAFVDPKSDIIVEVYYRKDGRRVYVYNKDELDVLRLSDSNLEKDKPFKCIRVRMRELNWGLHNDINECAITRNEEGDRYFNLKIFKETKLLKTIIEWNLTSKDISGKYSPLKLTPKNIGNLHQNIVEKIIIEYDRQCVLPEEELKKLESGRISTS